MGIKKRTKETPRSPLFTGITARFARAYARRKNVLLDARCAYCVCVCVLANYLDWPKIKCKKMQRIG